MTKTVTAVDSQPRGELLTCNLKPAPTPRAGERAEKEAATPGWEAAGLISKENLLARLVLGSWKVRASQPLPGGVLQLDTEVPRAQSHGPADALNATSVSQGRVLGAASGDREGKKNPHSRDRGGDEEPRSPGPAPRSVGLLSLSAFWYFTTEPLWMERARRCCSAFIHPSDEFVILCCI